jgi:hypothetical protein
MTLCTGDENGDDNGNGDENGDNGNGNNNNNTTNGDKSIKFIEIHHTPESPTVNEKLQFNVVIESNNPIVNVNVIVCKSDGVCFAAEKMAETPPNSNNYFLEWSIPTDLSAGEVLSYKTTAKDSLDNIAESEYIDITLS